MQKGVFLIIIFLLSYSIGKSQLEKTNWLVGGSASYSHAKYNTGIFNSNQEQYEFTISPSIGYFVVDKLACGVITSLYEAGSRFQTGSNWNKYSNFNFGPFARYYFLKKSRL